MPAADFGATQAYAFGSVAVSSTAVAITAAGFSWAAGDLDKARRATITAHTNAVVYTKNGTNPTATTGHVLAANATVVIDGNTNIQALKFIRQSSDAAVSVTLEY